MSLASMFLISNQHILGTLMWWLCGVLVVLSVFLFNRHRIKRGES